MALGATVIMVHPHDAEVIDRAVGELLEMMEMQGLSDESYHNHLADLRGLSKRINVALGLDAQNRA